MIILTKNYVLRFDVAMDHAFFVAEKQPLSDFSNHSLDSRLADMAFLVYALRLSVGRELVSLLAPIEKLSSWTVLHHDDKLVFKSFVIDNFERANNKWTVILSTLSKS